MTFRLLHILIFIFTAYCINAQNVFISSDNFPNEPAIIMDPLHPENLVAGANLRNYYISHDTGRTWQTGVLTSSFGVWGDPAITVDTAGDFYFFHLSNPQDGNWIDRIVCQKSNDAGETWNNGSFTGLNGEKEQDKEWPVVDRNTNTIYLTWTEFDEYGSFDPADSSRILFSKSTDAGISWSSPLKINKISGDCIDSDNTVEGAVPAVGPNGEVYVSWAGPAGIVFNKSLDEGETWLGHEIHVDPMPTGWDYEIPGITRANGLPITVCDLSDGPNRGTIYINWSDQRNGSNDTDVWLSKSTDGGDTWTAPKRVNDDAPGKHQFFTWMAIDQVTGYLYFVFYDRRNYNDITTDVYLAMSKDGGETFINRLISESPFVPSDGIFFGDYTNITAHNGIVRPIWTRLHNGELSIWTHLTNEQEIVLSTKDVETANNPNLENFPNPASDVVYVSYKLHTSSIINLSVIDANGSTIQNVITNDQRGYGKYVEKIEPGKLNLPAGIYFLQLKIDDQVHTLRQVIID